MINYNTVISIRYYQGEIEKQKERERVRYGHRNGLTPVGAQRNQVPVDLNEHINTGCFSKQLGMFRLQHTWTGLGRLLCKCNRLQITRYPI